MHTTNRRSRGDSPGWLLQYPKEWFRPDLVAGLTSAAVVLPKALAYATIAGLPVQIGLYTAFVPMVIYALLGTSRPLSVSTTTTISILAATSLGLAAPNGDMAQLLPATATLSVLVGAILLLAWALRLGFIANFISEPVLVGFKSGIGFVIIVDQIPKLLGIHIEKAGFFRDIWAIFGHLPETSVATLVFAAATLGLIIVLEHLVPRAPVPLIAVAAGIAASTLLGLQHAGVELVGAVPRGLPTPIAPRLDLVQVLWPGAVGIALMSFTETIASARAFSRSGEPRPIPNRELLAIGAANVGGGLIGAMPSGGGTSQTAVNRMAGARSQMAELVTAATALATLLFLAPLLGLMPKATLAAVVVAYSVGLISPSEFRAIRRVRRTEFAWALLALVGVALLGTLKGILVAVVVSLVSLAHQAYRPPLYPLGRKRGTQAFRALSEEHPDDETWPGLLILRFDGRIFFANAQQAGDKLWEFIDEYKPRVLLLDCSSVIDIEYTALRMLIEGEERLRREGITLWLAALNPEALRIVNNSSLGQALGRERMFFNVQMAVARYEQSAGKEHHEVHHDEEA